MRDWPRGLRHSQPGVRHTTRGLHDTKRRACEATHGLRDSSVGRVRQSEVAVTQSGLRSIHAGLALRQLLA
jgi:hypothetical protein